MNSINGQKRNISQQMKSFAIFFFFCFYEMLNRQYTEHPWSVTMIAFQDFLFIT